MATLVGLVLLLPTIIRLVPWPEMAFDLSDRIPEECRALVSNRTVTVKLDMNRTRKWDLVVHGQGQLLDWPYTLRVKTNYSLFGRHADGHFSLWLTDTPWKISGRFSASTAQGWEVRVSMQDAELVRKDPVLGQLLDRLPMSGISDLDFNGKLSFEAQAFTTNALPLPTWTASARLSDFSASLKASDSPIAVRNLRLRAGASGLGPKVEIAPLFPRIDAIEASDVVLSNAFASIRATEKSFLVTEAGSDVFGGQVRLYALFLNPERLSAGFTLFLDDIDTGAVFKRLEGFKGTASGRLHGKMPLRILDGTKFVFGDSYLYSIPGETGKIRMEEATPILDNLAATGVSKSDCDNLAKALKCLDYTALNLNMKRDEDGERHALNFKLEGSATSGKVSVPVSFDVTLRGNIQQLINTGLQAAGK